MSESLTLFIHHGKNQVDKVTVDSTDAVQNLDKHLETLPKMRFVFFNNMLLVGSFSYQFYKIQNGDHLFVAPVGLSLGVKLKNTLLHYLIPMPPEEKKEIKPNPEKRITSFFRETARVKDQQLQKVEGTAATHSRALGLFSNIMRPKPPPPPPPPLIPQTPTVIPPKQSEPSSDSLPPLWIKPKEEEDLMEEDYIESDDIDQENE